MTSGYHGLDYVADNPQEVERFAKVFERLRPECERIIAQYEHSRSALLPILHLLQQNEGWTSPPALQAVAELLDLPLSVVESTATFYTLIFRKPVGKYMLQPCRGLACIINGAEKTNAHFRERLGVGQLETTADGVFSYEEVECLAACDRAPCMQVNLEFAYDLTPERIDAMLADIRAGSYPVAAAPQTAKPGPTWHVAQDTAPKAVGARDVPDPDDPGGIGDRTGVDMLRRLEKDPYPIEVRPTRERLVVDGAQVLEVVPSGDGVVSH